MNKRSEIAAAIKLAVESEFPERNLERKMQTRIYKIVNRVTGEVKLVEAALPSQAVRHVVRSEYVASVASQRDLVALTQHGVRVETAGND